MATKEEHCDNATEDSAGDMTACESNRSVYGFEEYVIGDVKHEISNMYTKTDSLLPEISDIKVENEMITFELKKEANECLDDEMVVNEDTTYTNGIKLNNHIKDEKIELSYYPTGSNETELAFQIAEDIVDDEVKIEDQIIADNMHIKFENKFLSCDHCNEVYEDYCPKCRMLIYVLNGNALSDFDEGVAKEIPNGILEIRELPEHHGIYSLKHLPVGVKFGPFTGLRNTDSSWRIKAGKFIVSDDKLELLNWMQLISPAKNVLEHNLTVFVYEDNIYYRSVKEIQEGEELLVYFGFKYDISLINDVEVDFIPTIETDAEDVYACTICCLGFKSSVYLTEHKIICVYGTEENSGNKDIKQCSNCKIYLEHWEYEQYHMPYCYDKDGRLCILSAPHDQTMASSSSIRQHALYKRDSNEHYNEKHTYAVSYKKITQKINLKLHGANVQSDIENPKVVLCYLCEYQTNCISNLKVHLQSSHFKDGKYMCTKCTYETKLVSSLGRHFKTHGTVKQFKCSKCDYVTNRQYNLKMHYFIHETAKRLKCSKCDYATNRQQNFKLHSYTHEMGKRFKCTNCDYVTNYHRDLKIHSYTHETAKRFKCFKCDYATNRQYDFKAHSCKYETVKRLKCSKCDYATNRLQNLKIHSYTHETVKRFKCSKCDYRTHRRHDLKVHSRKHETVKSFKCSKCDYATKYQRNLKTHSYKHENAKRFKCSECDYGTSLESNLRRHYYTHETVNRYKCSKCDYATIWQKKFMRHAYAHDVVKRFECSECDYSTNSEPSLRRHYYTHETVKRYKCSKCDFATIWQKNLVRHVYTHETTKRFKCSECDYITNAQRNLKIHLLRHGTVK